MKCLAVIGSLFLLPAISLAQSDNCATATTIPLTNGSACVNGTSANATSALIMYGACNAAPVNEVWYTYVVQGPQNDFTITPTGGGGSLTDAEIIIYSGGCGVTLELCNTATGTNVLNSSWGFAIGTQVWIGVASNGGTDGDFELCVNSYDAPPTGGNGCGGAIPVCSGVTTVDMNTMTPSGTYPSCFWSAVNQDVWFTFDVLASGTFEWSAVPSGVSQNVELDWALYDITGGCPGAEIDCNYNYDGANSAPNGQTPGGGGEFNPPSNLTAGNTYAIVVDFFSNSAVGTMDFSIDGGSAVVAPLADFSISPVGPTCASSVNVTINDNSIGVPDYDFGNGNNYTGNSPPSQNYTTPGTYAITAIIGGACPSTHTEFVELFGPLVTTITTTPDTCGNCNGTATAVTTGGSGLYDFLWANNATTSSISGLCAGPVDITVTDQVCATTASDPTSVSAITGPTVSVNCQDATTQGAADGQSTATPSGGTTPYTYAWSPAPASGQTGATATGLTANTYTVTLTDDNNCTATATCTVNEPGCGMSATTSQNNVLCFGLSTGDATVNPSGGATPYTYTWDDGNSQTTQTATGLSAGVYSVTVTDDLLCTVTAQVTITEPASALSATTTCNDASAQGANDGSSTANPSGGTSSYTFLWDDGNAQTTQTATGLGAGTYNVTVTDANNCPFVTSCTVNEPCMVTADFSAPSVCMYDSVTFSDLSTTNPGNVISWNWDFGDGNSSTLKNPKHLYTLNSTYNVTLSVTTDSGCNATVILPVNIHAVPNALLNATNTCLYDSVQFTDNSNPASIITGWNWDFGDGNSSTSQHPAHLYTTSGSYTIGLVVYSDSGCTDTANGAVTVHSVPQAQASAANGCTGTVTQFNDGSTIVNGVLTGWNWNFGDNSPADNSQNPTHQYGNPGAYNVELVAISANLCVDTDTVVVVVHPVPVAGFNFNDACDYESVNFIDASLLSSGNMANWSWDFGDGNTSVLQNPSHQYAAANTYNVQLTVNSDSGCTDVINQQVTIHPKPNADFTVTNDCEDQPIVLTDNSTVTGTPSWNWSFGDGNTSVLQNPNHQYASAGTYTVELIVASGFGCADTITKTATAYPNPTADFGFQNVCLGDPMNFIDQSLVDISNGDIISNWIWIMGDGSPQVTNQNPTHNYASSGTYTVYLTVQTANGCLGYMNYDVQVYDDPVASFTATVVCANQPPTLFQDNSIAGSGAINDYQWSFGDNNTSNAVGSTSHSYASGGAYTAQLVVTDNNNCVDSTSVQVVVNAIPIPDFSFTSRCEYDSIPFADLTNATPPITLNWDFDDGNIDVSNNPAPMHLYSSDGTYDVTLIAIDGNGCADTINNLVTVYPAPTAAFSIFPDSVNVQQADVEFIDETWVSGAGAISSWEWNFYDNQNFNALIGTSTSPNPTQNYASGQNNDGFLYFLGDTGDYPVTLVVETSNNCVDSVVDTVHVHGVHYLEIANAFTPNDDGINDVFFPKGIGIDPDREFQFYIFNRWGELVFEAHNLVVASWDGKHKETGLDLKQDVYVWRLSYFDLSGFKQPERTGHVTLIR